MTDYHEMNRTLIEQARKAENRRVSKALASRIAVIGLASLVADLLYAQLIVWGLSMYGIHSGIWGPWLLLEGVTSPFVTVIWLGMLRALRDARKAGTGDR